MTVNNTKPKNGYAIFGFKSPKKKAAHRAAFFLDYTEGLMGMRLSR